MSTVLVVDDEAPVRNLVTRWLTEAGHRADTASGADEALERLDRAPAEVALCDLRMPGRDGFWLASRVRERFAETAVIIATASQEFDAVVRGLRIGVLDYVSKPFTRAAITSAVDNGLRWHESAQRAREAREGLASRARTRQHQLAQALLQLEVTSDAAVDAIVRLLALHDPVAYDHASRVAGLSVRLARALSLGEAEIQQVQRGALLHDIGKAAMGDALLAKTGPLDERERQLVRRHPELGFDVLKSAGFLDGAAAIVLASHEAWDGSGYPRGLHGDEIPLGARIVAVADTFDVMTHERPYRSARASIEALTELQRCSGTQFDPRVIEALQTLDPCDEADLLNVSPR